MSGKCKLCMSATDVELVEHSHGTAWICEACIAKLGESLFGDPISELEAEIEQKDVKILSLGQNRNMLEAEVARLKTITCAECNNKPCDYCNTVRELREENERLTAQGPTQTPEPMPPSKQSLGGMPGLTDRDLDHLIMDCNSCEWEIGDCDNHDCKLARDKILAELARRQAGKAQKKDPDHCPECGSDVKTLCKCTRKSNGTPPLHTCHVSIAKDCGSRCTNAWHDERKG